VQGRGGVRVGEEKRREKKGGSEGKVGKREEEEGKGEGKKGSGKGILAIPSLLPAPLYYTTSVTHLSKLHV